MKSQFQTLAFLSNYSYKTELDGEFINSFLAQRFQIPPKTLRNASNFNASPLDVQSFIRWFESGPAAFKIAKSERGVVLLGNCTLDRCEIIASMLSDGTLSTDVTEASPSLVGPASASERDSFLDCLFSARLQPDPKTLRLVTKYIPGFGERVVFYDFSLETRGVGVARHVYPDGEVEFFCYFTYPTPSSPRRVGYGMEERPGFNLRSMVFENIDDENIATTLGNSTSCFRRLGRELEREGKTWKDKILRIEPSHMKAQKGKRYYYISDSMSVVSDTEKGSTVSRRRYLSGNYFTSQKAADKMLARFNDMLLGFLASPRWPEVD